MHDDADARGDAPIDTGRAARSDARPEARPDADDAYHAQCWGEPSPRAFARGCRVEGRAAGRVRVQVVDPAAVDPGVPR